MYLLCQQSYNSLKIIEKEENMMKKRRIVTIDELMNMSSQELSEFIENDEKLLSEGIGNPNESNVDFMGMTNEEVIQKYNLIPLEDAFNNIMNKLNQARYRHGNDKVCDGNGCVFEIDEKSPNCDVITKDFTEDEMKNDIFDLTEIPMEVLDKSYVRYEPYNLGITHRHPLRKKNKL